MFGLINIAILLLIVYLVFTAFSKNKNKKPNNVIKLLTNTRLKILITSYTVVLIIGSILFYGIQMQEDLEEPTIVNNELLTQNMFMENYYDALYNGSLSDDMEGVSKLDKWKFNIESDVLEIGPQQDNIHYHIVIDYVEEHKEEIEVELYGASMYFSGVEITPEQMPRSDIRMVNNRLTVVPHEYKEIRFAKLTKEFTITQFSEETNIYNENFHYSTGLMENVVIIRVPKDIELINNNLFDLVYIEG